MYGVIHVSDIKERKCIEWKIPQFFETSKNIDNYEDNIFLFQKKWLLMVGPRGMFGNSPEYVILSVIVTDPDSDFSVDLELDVKPPEIRIQNTEQDFSAGVEHYRMWSFRCKSSDLQTVLYNDIFRGRIIISSNLSSAVDAACQTTFLYNVVHFRRDFQDLLQTGRDSDATIDVQGRLFKVHKMILEACSPVFVKMFNNDIAEKNNGVVKVDDCDPDSFQNFLKCLYSGKLENISTKSLIDLYVVFSKYSLSDLKDKCSKMIVKELSEDTASEVVQIANMFGDTQLKESANRFILKKVVRSWAVETLEYIRSKYPSLAVRRLGNTVENEDSL